MEEKDPVTDREEFNKRLSHIFDPFQEKHTKELLLALVFGNQAKIDSYIANCNECEKCRLSYLEQYDACDCDEDRAKVVGSVRRQ